MIRKKAKSIKKLFSNSSLRSKKVIINIIGLTGVKIIDVLIGIFMVPLSIEYLGQNEYGIWLTLTSMVLWFNFFNGGLGHGLRNKLAENIAIGDFKKAKQYVSLTYFILVSISLSLLLFFIIIYNEINWQSWLNTKIISNHTLGILGIVVFGSFALQLSLNLIQTILSANQQPAKGQLINLVGKTIIFVGLIFAIKMDTKSILIYGMIYSFGTVFVLLIATFLLFYKDFRNIAPSLKSVNFTLFRDIGGLSIKFFIIQISIAVLFTSDNFIIAQLFTPNEVTPYQIAHKYFALVLMSFAVIMRPMWSAITDAYVLKEMDWIRNTVIKLLKIWVALIFVIILMLFVSKPIYELWVGEDIIISYTLSLGWALFVILQMLNMIFTYFLNGIGKVKIQVYTAILSLLINIPLSIFFAKTLNLGTAGVIFATNISILIYVIFRSIQYTKIINGKANGIWDK